MSDSTEPLRSEAIAAEMKAAEKRREELKGRVETLATEIEEQREQLGRAMAGVDSVGTVPKIRSALRDAEDELTASERGLGYLADEIQRLTAAKRVAQGHEATAASNEALTAAVEAIDALSEETIGCMNRLLPLIERAWSASVTSVELDGRAAKLTGSRLPSTQRVRADGWDRHPQLQAITADLMNRWQSDLSINSDSAR